MLTVNYDGKVLDIDFVDGDAPYKTTIVKFVEELIKAPIREFLNKTT